MNERNLQGVFLSSAGYVPLQYSFQLRKFFQLLSWMKFQKPKVISYCFVCLDDQSGHGHIQSLF